MSSGRTSSAGSNVGAPLPEPIRQVSAIACCPIIVGIVAIYLLFEFASAIAGGSTIGGICLIALAAYCIYRCHQNKKNGQGCTPC